MDRDSMIRLRMDRRLIRRRNWLSRGELERQLSDLPDVAHKATTGAGVEEKDAQPPEPGNSDPI